MSSATRGWPTDGLKLLGGARRSDFAADLTLILSTLLVLTTVGLERAHANEAKSATKPIRVLIVDGANNHDWRITTDALRATLNATGLFSVDVSTAPQSKMVRNAKEPRNADEATKRAMRNFVEQHQNPMRREMEREFGERWKKWKPTFSDYEAVLVNYNGRSWPQPMQDAFIRYVRNGGGVVLIHASNNAFRDWDEFNEIIGLGYNGKRGTSRGQCTKVNPKSGKTFLCCEGENSGHGSRHPFVVTVREPEHPIMKGIPGAWRHGRDELYHNLRGPARNMTVLSSAFSDPSQRGTGQHEPITMFVRYGKGRVIHTTMGHFWPGQTDWDALYCVGFQTVIARSCEFTATGKVTLDVPKSFPAAGRVSIKRPHEVRWTVGGKPTVEPTAAQTDWKAKIKSNPYSVLTPNEQRESFRIAEGFEIELVAAEPLVQEPVLAVWDADGAMYVAEMLSYMQDEKGTGTKTLNNGRVKRLVDTDGDGVMDKSTIFVDGLNLPRMILPLDERIAIVETDSTAVNAYTDTDGDGVADKKEFLFAGKVWKDRKKSVEHQNSGLIWNIDNWIYVSYNGERYRFTDGVWKSEPAMGIWAQWGMTRDDVGNLFRSANEQPLVAQVPRKYWAHVKRSTGREPRFVPTVGFPFDGDYLTSKTLCTVGDKGPNVDPNPKFTSLCGQEIYRGTALPRELYGNLFFVDPTIHVVRRSVVNNINGKVTLRNADDPGEFLLSPDFNFRPVNTHTGPDGCLYVVDMYRGIIQDAPWFSEGSREYARSKGFQKHIQRGRIWRIRHKDHEPRPLPRMLKESTTALVRHLFDENGWVRDTAQKLIILRASAKGLPAEERAQVVATLKALAKFQPDRPRARLHALWTLEGLNSIDRELLLVALQDRDPRVQSAAIQIAEVYIREDDADVYDQLTAIAKKAPPAVAKQLVMSLGWSQSKRSTDLIDQTVRKHIVDDGVYLAAMASLWGRETPLIRSVRDGTAFASIKDREKRDQSIARWSSGLAAWDYKRPQLPAEWTTKQKWLAGGEGIYFQACSRCHGPNGKGQKLPGHDLLVAPPLAGSPRVKGAPDEMIRILLHGLTGPVNGQTYGAGVMPKISALGHNHPNRITQVANFVRYAWGNGQEPVTVEYVKQVMEKTSDRQQPYTLKELGLDSGGFVNRKLEEELLASEPEKLAKLAQAHGDADRGKTVFYSKSVGCFSCHDPPAGAVRLGPDLSKLSSDVTPVALVESILRPSKKIDKNFAQAVVLTSDGKSVMGLRIDESEDAIVLRSTSDSRRIRIVRDDIESVHDSEVSLMPNGLAAQLKDRSQFYDLVKYLFTQRKSKEK